jgi:hypothetical protein
MFESILMRPNAGRNFPLNYGQLIENLFFYKETNVHIGREEIKSLFDLAEVDVLVELFRLSSLNVYFNNSHTAIITDDTLHSVDSIGIADLDLEKELYQESFQYKGDDTKSKKFAKKLSRLIKIHELPQLFNLTLNEQLKDEEFRTKVLYETFKETYPELQINLQDLRYELEYINDTQFKIHTSIDFEKFNKIGLNGPILSLINACEDLHLMSQKKSEISLPDFNSKIIRVKINSAIEKGIKSQKEIDVFNHFAFDESWALREAINSKKLLVKGALKALEKAEKYKSWLHNLPDDSNLMSEYQKKVEEKTVLESLPLRAVRFYIFTVASAILGELKPEIAIPTSIALSAFDSFILGNIKKKWTPNQFIENEYRPLAKKN